MLPERADVVILGAGLAGASTAWHLLREGISDVIVLERRAAPGLEASGHNAAILRLPESPPQLADWARASRPVLEALGVVHETGGLLIGAGDEAPPPDHPLNDVRGRHAAHAGVVDVPKLLSIYLSDVHVLAGVTAEPPVRYDAGWRIATDVGTIDARVVVNATGAWASRFGAGDLVPTRRHIAISAPDKRALATLPWLWDLATAWYVRPWDGAWLLCIGDEVPVDPDADMTPDAEVLTAIEERFAELLAPLPEPRLARAWAGHRTFAEDRLPRVGEDVSRPGLVHVAALGGHGVTVSPAAGAAAAAAVRTALAR
ncbi:MAG: FAD-binding oxidoreductase [Planctomycetes bacterium]|nr:FAD-binding oxidoreductase [Planctomycetota bacterium]